MERRSATTGKTARTTVALKHATKTRLDQNKSPGQCYDGFIGQLVDLWEKTDDRRRVR